VPAAALDERREKASLVLRLNLFRPAWCDYIAGAEHRLRVR
jgi:hypothetical protein